MMLHSFRGREKEWLSERKATLCITVCRRHVQDEKLPRTSYGQPQFKSSLGFPVLCGWSLQCYTFPF